VTTLVSANPLYNFATPYTSQGKILNGFVVDSAGNLYVSRASSNEIVKILPDGTQYLFYKGDTTAQYMGLAISPATGDIYAADWGNGYVMRLNQLGTPVGYTNNFYSSINGYSQRQSPQAVAIGINNVEFDLVNYNRYDPTVYVDNNARIFYGSSFESLYTIDPGVTGEISFSDFYNKQGRSDCVITVGNYYRSYSQSLPTSYVYTSYQTTYGRWQVRYYPTNYQDFVYGTHIFGYLNQVFPSPINGIASPADVDRVYVVTSGIGGWGDSGSFMNQTAIWEYNNSSAPSFSRTVPVYFPTTGTYGFTASYDNSGSIALDGNVISALSASYAWFLNTNNSNNYVNTAVTVTAGWHNISLNGTNTGGPGGLALQIRKGNPGWNSTDVTTYPIIFSTRDFNYYIDTIYPKNPYHSPNNLGGMTSGTEFGYAVTALYVFMDLSIQSISPYYTTYTYTTFSTLMITYPTDPGIAVLNPATGISVSPTATSGWINSTNGWNKISISARSNYTPSINTNDFWGGVAHNSAAQPSYPYFQYQGYNTGTHTATWRFSDNIFASAEATAPNSGYSSSWWSGASPAMADGSTFYITFFRYSDSTGYAP
jgi:hypothetical protein